MKYKILKGYVLNNIYKKNKLLFFHVPKCGGLSLSNALSSSLKHIRIWGEPLRINEFIEKNPLFKEAFDYKKNLFFKNVNISYNNFTATNFFNLTKFSYSNYPFVSGHIPFKNYHSDDNRLTFTLLRDPISRAISHYKAYLSNNFVQKNQSIEELYKNKILTPNLLTSFFSNIDNPNIEEAIHNLKKIDLVTDVSFIEDLINYLISYFNLPNIIFTTVNKSNIKLNLSSKDYSIFKNFNKKDIEFYKRSKSIIYNFDLTNTIERKNKYFSMYSEKKLYNNKYNIIIKEDNISKLLEFINKL